MEALPTRGKGTNVFIAIYCSAFEQKEQAYYCLDKAFATGDVDLVSLQPEPLFAPLVVTPDLLHN